MADCSKGGIRPPETHDRRQWTAEYVGSLAAWMTMTGDGGGWNQRQAGCVRHMINCRPGTRINFDRVPVENSQQYDYRNRELLERAPPSE